MEDPTLNQLIEHGFQVAFRATKEDPPEKPLPDEDPDEDDDDFDYGEDDDALFE